MTLINSERVSTTEKLGWRCFVLQLTKGVAKAETDEIEGSL